MRSINLLISGAGIFFLVAALVVFFSRFAGSAAMPGSMQTAPLAEELQCAAQDGETKVVSDIVKRAPGLVNHRDCCGWTPLHQAARGGHTKIANILLSAGAYVEAIDENGRTALHAAVQGGEPGTAKILLASHAYPNREDNFGRTPLWYAGRLKSERLKKLLRSYGGK